MTSYRNPLNLTTRQLAVLKMIRRCTEVGIPYPRCPKTCAVFEDQGWVFLDHYKKGYYVTPAGCKRLAEAEGNTK